MIKSTSLAIATTIFAFATSSHAGDAPLRNDVTDAARQGQLLQHGAVVTDIRLFELPGSQQFNDVVAEEILKGLIQAKAVADGDLDRVEDFGDRFVMAGSDWILSVAGDGTEVSYRDLGSKRTNPSTKGLPKLPDAQLAALARSFVEEDLARRLELSSTEGLELWKTMFEHESGAADDGSEAYDHVVSNIALFTRTLDGIPVIGQGSKVEVELANDGSIIGFSFDWPRLMLGEQRQTVARPSVVLGRVASLFPSTRGTLKVPHHECGYFDPGSGYRDPYAPLQAGCLTWVERTEVDSKVNQPMRSGVIFATPIGETVEYDAELEASHSLLTGKLDGVSQLVQFGPSTKAALQALTRKP